MFYEQARSYAEAKHAYDPSFTKSESPANCMQPQLVPSSCLVYKSQNNNHVYYSAICGTSSRYWSGIRSNVVS